METSVRESTKLADLSHALELKVASYSLLVQCWSIAFVLSPV